MQTLKIRDWYSMGTHVGVCVQVVVLRTVLVVVVVVRCIAPLFIVLPCVALPFFVVHCLKAPHYALTGFKQSEDCAAMLN